MAAAPRGREARRPLGASIPVLKQVLVLVEEDRDLRVAHALAADATIDRVAVMGESRSNSLERVDDPSGFNVIVSRTATAVDVAAKVGGSAVTAAEVSTSPVPTVDGASLLGFALAMAARMESEGADILRVAIAHPSGPTTGTIGIHFPPPVGRLKATVCLEDPFPVVVGRTKETWGTALIESNIGDQALIDDYAFLAPICLAAAVVLVPPAGVLKVWDAPAAYLGKAEEMGLVAAARTRG